MFKVVLGIEEEVLRTICQDSSLSTMPSASRSAAVGTGEKQERPEPGSSGNPSNLLEACSNNRGHVGCPR